VIIFSPDLTKTGRDSSLMSARRTAWIAAVTYMVRCTLPGCGARPWPRSRRCLPARQDQRARPPPPGPPRARRPRWMCCADRFRSMCTLMAAGPALRRKRRRAATWRMRCVRDPCRWRVLPTSRTCRCSDAVPKVPSRWCAHPQRANFTATTSTGSPGWTCWLLITACVARSAPPIWRKRIERRSRR
jgi:hypothetical protein